MNLYNQKEFRHSLLEKKFTEEERKTLSKKGFALPDGSFPIENENDLENAIHAIGRAKDKEAAKKHIIKRAQALEKERLVPTSWLNESLTVEEESNLESRIKDIIQSEIYLRDVPYSMSEEKDMEVDPDSIDDAAKAILKEISPLLNSEIKEAKTDMSYRLSDDDKHNVDYEFSHIDQNLEPSEIVDKISDKLGINWFEVSAYLKHNGLKTKVNESNDGLKKIVLQIYPNGSKSNSYIEIDNNFNEILENKTYDITVMLDILNYFLSIKLNIGKITMIYEQRSEIIKNLESVLSDPKLFKKVNI